MNQALSLFNEYCKSNPTLRALFLTRDGRIVVYQLPNRPLILALALLFVTLITTGSVHQITRYAEAVAFLYWSYLEITKGDNLFRKILGGAVALDIVWHLL